MAGRPSGFLVDLFTTAPVHLPWGGSQELKLGVKVDVFLCSLVIAVRERLVSLKIHR